MVRFEYRTGDSVDDPETLAVVEPAADDGGPARLRVTIGDRQAEVEVVGHRDGRMTLRIDGRNVTAWVARADEERLVQLAGGAPQRFLVGRRRSGGAAGGSAAEGAFTASMHSQVVSVNVSPGDEVQRGDTLVVLEAMKMESRLSATFAGRVVAVHCAAGDVVERGKALLEVEPL